MTALATAPVLPRATVTAESFEPVFTPTPRTHKARATLAILGPGLSRAVEVYATHSKDARALYAVLTRVTIEQTPTALVVNYQPMRDVARFLVRPVARYSEKALAAFYDEALALAVERLSGDLAWMLDPADD